MEGRKMAIVPFKLWEDMKRWKEEQIQKPRLPPDPNVSATASLQRDLSSVMANEDLSETEKSQLYGQTLYKFIKAHEKALKEQSSKLLPSLAKTATSSSTHSKINQLVVDSVPKMFKRKAQLLLSILQDNPNMSWDEDGTVKLYGKPIQGSNIIDLVNGVVRQRKRIEPTGWQPFAEGLRELNIPQDVIGNRERWDWMHRSPNLPPRTPEEEFITPPPPNQKRVSTIRKRASRIPISKTKRSATTRKLKGESFSPSTLPLKKQQIKELYSPQFLSATKKHIKEELFSPKQWLKYDDQQ